MRIAFPLISAEDWTGGHNYLLSLITALVTQYPEKVTPIIFYGQDIAIEETYSFACLPRVELVNSSAFNRNRRLYSLAVSVALGADFSIKKLMQQHRIDIIFEVAQFFGVRIGIPAIAWMPDFQHRHIPKFFSKFAKLKREIGFLAQINAGRTLLLSSKDACSDCERFYPATKGKTHIVQFAVPPPLPMSFDVARGIADSYGLPKNFFYLPNQFSIHKNHQLVANAIKIISNQGGRLVVAASGSTLDHRDLNNYTNLCNQIKTLDIQENFRFLGFIPYQHVSALMQVSDALINPSLFEGWSTTVEEARALGVPLILSDLAIHREQVGEIAHFFDRWSADSLAETLYKFRSVHYTERERKKNDATADSERRFSEFAEKFMKVTEACYREVVA
jgi:glycosyltransferase involved in cell wall biosynthesis